MDKTYFTIYRVTNKISGKIYIGSHKTKNLDDGYCGSGKYLRRSIDKHGIENFVKEILFVFDTAEEMFAKETELVSEDFLANENTYNLKIGGSGGWDYLNRDKNNSSHTSEHIQMMNKRRLEKLENDPNFITTWREAVVLGQKKKQKENWSPALKMIKYNKIHFPNGTFFGRKHSEETKKKMSLAKKGRTTSWIKGKHHTQETKDKIRATHKKLGTKPPNRKGMISKNYI